MSTYSEYEGRPELVQKRARVLLVRNSVLGLLCVLAFASLALDFYTNLSAGQARDTLIDCVDPAGTCYKDGQERTGEAVTGIVVGTRQVIIATQVCNNRKPSATVDELEKCVDKEIKNGQQGNR